MQQRQLRLGDILDDYCPRERRITNHAVVAMIGDDVKQTRCTTCDTEHEFKQAKVPAQRRKKDATAAHAAPVVETAAPKTAQKRRLGREDMKVPTELSTATSKAESVANEAVDQTTDLRVVTAGAESDGDESVAPVSPVSEEEGPVRRPLIRATLPRPEGQTVTRPAPEFTIRQSNARPTKFRETPGRGQNRAGAGGGSGHGHGMGAHRPSGTRSGDSPRGTGGRPVAARGPKRHTDRPAPHPQQRHTPHAPHAAQAQGRRSSKKRSK